MNETTDKLPEWRAATAHAARMVGRNIAGSLIGAWTLVGLAAGLFLAMIGALGSYDYGPGIRLAFWLPLSLTAAAVAGLIEFAFNRLGWPPAGRWRRWGVFILAFAGVMTPIAYGANSLQTLRPLSDLVMYLQNSLILSAAYTGGRLALRALVGRPAAPAAEPEEDPAAALMRRLAPGLRAARLLAVSSEGHYVRVHTDAGSELLLLRLKDAMADLARADGAQTHRSWWVARDAVEAVEREGDRVMLKLVNGETAPVSRQQGRVLREAGWF